jgi:hypothetical protein
MRGLFATFLGAVLAVLPADGRAGGAEEPAKAGDEMSLEPLFDLTLQYRPEMAPVVSAEGREGTLLGSGDGRVDGARLRGAVRWSIFEVTGAEHCKVNLVGTIQTEDGRSVVFDAVGFGVVGDPRLPDRWHMNAAVQFRTDTEGPHAWLNPLLAVWDGRFDMRTGQHVYRAYAPTPREH